MLENEYAYFLPVTNTRLSFEYFEALVLNFPAFVSVEFTTEAALKLSFVSDLDRGTEKNTHEMKYK